MADTLQGRRLPDGEWFDRRSAGTLEPGDYGVESITKLSGTPEERVDRDWFCCLPDGATTVLWVNEDDRNGNRHLITEHDDGTITVGGSVLGQKVPTLPIIGEGRRIETTWHGFLERGVWREV